MPSPETCSYVVGLERAPSDDELRDLAAYLSDLRVAGCEVIVLDAATGEQFRRHERVLRWVSRHLRVRVEDRTPSGRIDLVRAAGRVASCEKLIAAADDVRWKRRSVDEACLALDLHDSVEPADVPDPLRWWSAVDAAQMLMDRGIAPDAGIAATVAVRRRSARMFRRPAGKSPRLAGWGELPRLVVTRVPPPLDRWISDRPVKAAADFDAPVRSGFFLSVLPMMIFFLLAGGPRFAAVLSAIGAAGAVLLAFHGRSSLAQAFPTRACFLAPLAVLEKSVSVYWALGRKMGSDASAEVAASVVDPATREAARAVADLTPSGWKRRVDR